MTMRPIQSPCLSSPVVGLGMSGAMQAAPWLLGAFLGV